MCLTTTTGPPSGTISDDDITEVLNCLTSPRPQDHSIDGNVVVKVLKCLINASGPPYYTIKGDLVVKVVKCLTKEKEPLEQECFKELLACLGQLESDVGKALEFVKGTIDMVSSVFQIVIWF